MGARAVDARRHRATAGEPAVVPDGEHLSGDWRAGGGRAELFGDRAVQPRPVAHGDGERHLERARDRVRWGRRRRVPRHERQRSARPERAGDPGRPYHGGIAAGGERCGGSVRCRIAAVFRADDGRAGFGLAPESDVDHRSTRTRGRASAELVRATLHPGAAGRGYRRRDRNGQRGARPSRRRSANLECRDAGDPARRELLGRIVRVLQAAPGIV